MVTPPYFDCNIGATRDNSSALNLDDNLFSCSTSDVENSRMSRSKSMTPKRLGTRPSDSANSGFLWCNNSCCIGRAFAALGHDAIARSHLKRINQLLNLASNLQHGDLLSMRESLLWIYRA